MEKNLHKRLDAYFWWLIWLLPLLGALICLLLGDDNTFTDFASFVGNFKFDFIANVLDELENVTSFQLPPILKSYASYVVSVEIVHVFVDFIVFIPRLCHRLADPATYDFGRKLR